MGTAEVTVSYDTASPDTEDVIVELSWTPAHRVGWVIKRRLLTSLAPRAEQWATDLIVDTDLYSQILDHGVLSQRVGELGLANLDRVPLPHHPSDHSHYLHKDHPAYSAVNGTGGARTLRAPKLVHGRVSSDAEGPDRAIGTLPVRGPVKPPDGRVAKFHSPE